MRVIGGEFRSRRLKTVPGLTTRPTPDRLREALFNVLTPRIENTVFLDAYAGTGAVAIEALSRGARLAILFERDPKALEAIRENLQSLSLASRAIVEKGLALRLLKKHDADIVFLDPPYQKIQEYEEALMLLAAQSCELVVAQHESRFTLGDVFESLKKTRVLRQGDNSLSFFER